MILPAVTFAVMVVAFLAGTMKLSWPAGLATACAALLGLLVGQGRLDIPLLVEGSFGFFDVGIIIATAMLFMKALEQAGFLEDLTGRLLGTLGNRRWLVLAACMFLVMLPGMLTGSSTAAVLTTGRFVVPVLLALGMLPERAAAFVGLASIAGMIAPPVNIPAMIIGSGVDMPYVGFELPLLLISVPLALGIIIVFGSRLPRRSTMAQGTVQLAAGLSSAKRVSLWRLVLPFALVIGPMIGVRLWPGVVPDTGLAVIFALGALSVWAVHPRLNVVAAFRGSLELSMPILGILAGAGMFVEVMTRTGVRGLIVSSALLLPAQYLILAAAVVVPLFGAVSAYASASVLGVPFLLAMLGKGDVAIAAAISSLAAIGDLMPPIALVPSLSVQAFTEAPSRKKTIALCLLGGVALIALAAGLVYLVRYTGFLA